jgi:hypothetical protein
MATLFHFQELLRQRNIIDCDRITVELLRIHLTQKAYEQKYNHLQNVDEASLYELMKETTEKRLGYFPGDPSWFYELFQVGKEIDFFQALKEIFQKDRSGVMVSPAYLVDYFSRSLMDGHIETVLIAEAHKHLNGLIELIETNLDKNFVLTAEKKWLAEALKFLFEHCNHVKVLQVSIYSLLPLDQEFDLIIAIPAFGFKPEVNTERFMTRESEGIATENLLDWLNEFGELQIVVPARFTFSGGSFAKLRSWILQHFNIKSIFTLPEGTLRPYTGMKTYLITISHQPVDSIQLGSLELKKGQFLPRVQKEIDQEELEEREDWRIELLLADDQEDLLGGLAGPNREVVKLKEIAELFRGKSIMKSHIQPGEISVLNISNIEDGEIIWEGMDTIDEEYRKVRRYELEPGDLVMTCRGTVNKVAVVRELPKKVIASANIIVVRFSKEVMSEYVKIFLESPVGTQLVKTFQRGTTVMNINPADLGEMEIPLPDIAEQRKIVEEYRKEHQLYFETVRKAKERWEKKRQQIYDQLLD